MTPLLIPQNGDWRHRFRFFDDVGQAEEISASTPTVVLRHQSTGRMITLALGAGLAEASEANAFDVLVDQANVAVWTPGLWAAEIRLAHPDGYREVAASLDITIVAFGAAADGGVTAIYKQSDATRIVRVTSGPPGAGAGEASAVAYNDALTMLGVSNVQDAITALYALVAGAQPPAPAGALDFSKSINSPLLGAI